MSDRPRHPPSATRTGQQAMILLIVGVVLLLPPMAGIFQMDAKIMGVPVTLVYLFVVWAVLIALTARLARRLAASVDGSDPGP